MDGISNAFAAASAMQQEQVNLQVQMTMMKKQLEVQKEVGQMLVGLIQTATGSSMHSGKAVGLGSNIDIFA